MVSATVMQQEDVDYVLVSNASLDSKETAYRNCFEDGLKFKGLCLQREKIENHIYTKLSLPDDVKFKYFEILELRMPLLIVEPPKIKFRRLSVQFLDEVQKCVCLDRIQIVLKRLRNYYLHEDDDMEEIKKQFFAPFKEKQRDIFDLESEYAKKRIWKIHVIHYILSRQKWRAEDPDECYIGIEALINQNIYTAAFPLHDGNYTDEGTMRNNLYKSWGTLCLWKDLASLDNMRDYMGNKCAVYFAWLEFYTKMLLPASVFGILLILYGLVTLPTDKFSESVCKATNVTMCPVCDYICDYYRLSRNCVYAKVTHLFDNDFTIVYSTLMALWTSVLSGLWRRRMILLQRKWNLLDSIDEKPGIKYIRQLEEYRKIAGNADAKNIPWSLKFTAVCISSSIILFFILLIIIAVISILVYQIWITGVVYSMNEDCCMLSQYGSFIISFTSSALNLVTITILNNVYSKVAVFLNDRELHRTQSEYDRALIVKNFVFQFINTYASIFYIALFKGKFIGYPGHYNRIFGYRQPECNYGGCLMELNIQLAVIMIGPQIIKSFMEMITTFLRVHLKRVFSNKDAEQRSELSESIPISRVGKQYRNVQTNASRWEEDIQLLDYEKEGGLFREYLELTIQFGFVILFTPAFPLAPFFAWIKNNFEIRLDAKKILTLYRRLVPRLNPNMMIWLEIFNFIGDLAILINAIVIAFSSNVITHFAYMLYNNGEDIGYFNATLSAYSISDLDRRSIPKSSSNVSVCYYTGFRNPYWSEYEYEPTSLYWHILVAKIIFIIFYQNIIFTLKKLILKWIPETPRRLHRFQKKERDFILNSLEPKDPEGLQYPSENVLLGSQPDLSKTRI